MCVYIILFLVTTNDDEKGGREREREKKKMALLFLFFSCSLFGSLSSKERKKDFATPFFFTLSLDCFDSLVRCSLFVRY